MSKTITIPKNRDNKSSKIVFPEICPGCFLNKVDSRTNNRESSSFITTENLSDFFTASIIYIGNIHRLFIPQMALWLEIPACKKCSKKSRILMILMYFFEIIGATSFALGVILGFFISESAKDAMVPILGTFFGIGIWGTPITILLIKYSFKIKHLEPDGKGDNFQISNEQYAKEFAILNNCWTKEQEEENSRKFCSICNLILHKPLYFVSKSNQRDHDKFVNDICHKCGNPLVDINTQKDSESQLLQNLKFEIFNVKKQQNKTLDTVSSISGVMWFISALAGLVLFFLNLIGTISNDSLSANLSMAFTFILFIISLIVWLKTGDHANKLTINEICRNLNTNTNEVQFLNKSSSIVTGIFYSNGYFAFCKPDDESITSFYEIIKIGRNQVSYIEPIMHPINFNDIMKFEGLVDVTNPINAFLTKGNTVDFIGKLVDEVCSDKNEKKDIVCGIKLHFSNNNSRFISYYFQPSIAITDAKTKLLEQINEILKSLVPLEKENFIIKS